MVTYSFLFSFRRKRYRDYLYEFCLFSTVSNETTLLRTFFVLIARFHGYCLKKIVETIEFLSWERYDLFILWLEALGCSVCLILFFKCFVSYHLYLFRFALIKLNVFFKQYLNIYLYTEIRVIVRSTCKYNFFWCLLCFSSVSRLNVHRKSLSRTSKRFLLFLFQIVVALNLSKLAAWKFPLLICNF